MAFYYTSIAHITMLALVGFASPVAQAAEATVNKSSKKVSVNAKQNPSSAIPTMPNAAVTPTATMSPVDPASSQTTVFTPDTIQWMPASNSLPEGSKIAILEGDPNKEGSFTIRVKFPANYMNIPHSHPKTEHMTVISGTFNLGIGQKFDSTNGKVMPVGSFVIIPPGVPHYGWGTEETVLQIHGMGPREKVLINPIDNLSNNSLNSTMAVKPASAKSSD